MGGGICQLRRTHSWFESILSEDIDWKAFAAFPPSVRLAVLVGQPSEAGPYTIRVWVPRGVKLMPHRHPEARVYTVISGVFYIGLGDRFDLDQLQAYPPGSVIVLPGNTFHFHWAKSSEYVTQVTALGPLGLEYLNATNNPRNHASQGADRSVQIDSRREQYRTSFRSTAFHSSWHRRWSKLFFSGPRAIAIAENVAVLDDGGNLKAFARMDGEPILSIEIAQHKAYTALFGLPTQELFKYIQTDPSLLVGILRLARVAPYGGGFPITIDGAIVGAIGVSGGTVPNDVECAEAGLAAIR